MEYCFPLMRVNRFGVNPLVPMLGKGHDEAEVRWILSGRAHTGEQKRHVKRDQGGTPDVSSGGGFRPGSRWSSRAAER